MANESSRINLTSLIQVELIARGVLKNVDCPSLLNARSSSVALQEAVDRARVWKIVLYKDIKWKRMLKIMVQLGLESEPIENDVELYKELYLSIHHNMKVLEKSWITETAYRKVVKLPYPGYVERLNFKIKMNEQFLVTRKNSHSIEIFNRWTMIPEYVFDIGVDSRVMMKSVDLSNDFLAVGCNRGQIFVWCLRTKELVYKLVDDPALLANESFAQNVMASRVDCTNVRFSPNGTALFSCISNNSCQYETLTLRKVFPGREMTITHQETIHQFNVRQVSFDDSYIYILGANKKGIQIRSPVTLDLLNTIASETGEFIKSFQPHEKYIIVAGRESISVWSTESAKCIHRLQMDPTDGYIKNVGLVGNKYIVSCHVIGWSSDFYVLGVNIWELQTFVKPLTSEEREIKPIFTHSISTQFWHDRNQEGVRDSLVKKLKVFIDDYQIGCLLTWEYDYATRETPTPMLYLIDILNKLD